MLEQIKFLNVSGWFNEAEKVITAIVKRRSKTKPELITITNFNIGFADGKILSKIMAFVII